MAILLGMDSLEHPSDFLNLAVRHNRKDIAMDMDHATLPASSRKKLTQYLDQAQTFV